MHDMTYCLRFNLYAGHSTKINKITSDFHFHTWSLAVYVDANKRFEGFYRFEKIINDILNGLSNKNLNEIPPFNEIEPTMENLGHYLFEKISETLNEYDLEIIKFEISETPSRIYVIKNSKYEQSDNIKLSSNRFFKELIYYTADIATKVNRSKYDEEEILNLPQRTDEDNISLKNEKKSETLNLSDKEYKYLWLKTIAAFVFILLSGALLLWYVNKRGSYPWGSDSFGHIFKSDLLYNSIKQGVFYPLYTHLWYNGIQPFRYWAPFPYYILALFQFAGNGDAIVAYNIFIYFCFTVGAFGWLLWGVKEKKVFVATLMGILWFCMPDNIRVFFSEGNIPRITIAVLLPYIFFFIWQYIEYRKKYALPAVIIIMSVISICHLMIGAMVGITTFIFMVYYGIQNKSFGRPIQVIIGMLLGISICGIWLYPALHGGLLAIDTEAVAEVMRALTFKYTQSLNPVLRFSNIELYYFGVTFLLVAVFGVVMSSKKSIPGFLTLITVFLGTTTAFVPILIKLPFNQLLWMMRFTPVAYSIFALSIILWKNIKRYVAIIIMLMIFIDSGISFKLLAFNTNPPPDTIRMLDESLKITNQRIAILDNSQFGSFPSYYICSGNKQIPYAYGWAWQGAQTANNIVLLNTALEKGFYTYMFDRCIELGCDTVIVKKDLIKDLDKLGFDAGKSQYYLVKEFNNGYLYKRETPKSFGMTVHYYGLAIGDSASNICLQFPGYEIAGKEVLDDFTLDELLKYEVIYISGFKYKSKEKAENLMYDAAEHGVKVVVDMNRVPNDPITNRLTFMEVTAQPIQFENKLPDLHFLNDVYFPTSFKEEFKKWNTVYLEDVPNPTGFSWMGGNKLTFIGQGENRNINYVGFNLLYHGIVNEDNTMFDVYAGIMGENAETLPEREIVPIDVSFEHNKIIINTPITDVVTTLANLDALKTNQETYTLHNLLCTKELHTELQITYPYLKEGIIISLIGIAATLMFLYFALKNRGENKLDKNNDT